MIGQVLPCDDVGSITLFCHVTRPSVIPASEQQKPYVPESCCVSDAYYNILNKEVCQKWKMGPPGTLAKGAYNHALNYNVGSCVHCFIGLAFLWKA